MIVVHHLEKSRSQRILWLLEELGLKYEVRLYLRDRETLLAPPELLAIHPLGKSPVVSLPEGPMDPVNSPLTTPSPSAAAASSSSPQMLNLAESGAIIETLLARYDGEHRLHPAPGTRALIDYTYWLHFAEGSAMPPLLLSLIFQRMPKAPMPFFIRPIVRTIADRVRSGFVTPQLVRLRDFLEQSLSDRPWFAGERFSAADIQMIYPVAALLARGQQASQDSHELQTTPHLTEWFARCQGRPAWQRALERGGPFEIPS